MKKTLISFFLFLFFLSGFAQQALDLKNWKFKTGDNIEWAKTGYDDSSWKPIEVGKNWEVQGYTDYHGIAWYRISFNLPSEMKKKAFLKDSILFMLGEIDDCDQTFLNGRLIGQNAEFIPADKTISPLPDLSKMESLWNKPRDYVLSVNDPRLKWDKVNVLAVRVYDRGGVGGMCKSVCVKMQELNDCMVIDAKSKAWETTKDGTIKKSIILRNNSPMSVKGKLAVAVVSADKKLVFFKKEFPVDLKAGEAVYAVNFKGDKTKRMEAVCSFTESKSGSRIVTVQDYPYILTPKSAETPQINGAKVVGVRPGSPFLFRVAATGDRPMSFKAENLPEGLQLDSNTGIITGKLDQTGEYVVKLKATNAKGVFARNLKIVVGDRIALTPPMGWNSWNCFALTVDEEKVKATADIFIKTGIANHGWTYINIDDGWEAPERDAQGQIVPNEKFKDMKALTDYIHGYGLKAGLYSSPGTRTCGGYLGSYQHEESDAKTYADWGFDYLKYDWCSYDQIAKDHSIGELQKPYYVMRSALNKANRDIVYSLCQYGMGDVWQWGDKVGGNLWRTTGDIWETWDRMSEIGFHQEAGTTYAKPGNWNDPDMLVVGWVGFGNLHPTDLTPSEQYTHISLWSLLSAPLLIGCDFTKLDEFTLNLLTNDEVIDIDQDPLGKQAVAVVKTNDYQIFEKELEDGSRAVGLFNLTKKDLAISAPWNVLKLSGKQKVRDVWRQKNLGTFTGSFGSVVPPHGVVLVKISK